MAQCCKASLRELGLRRLWFVFQNSTSAQLTLDEQRAIHDESRNAGIAEAEQKAKALRDENAQEGKGPGSQQPGQDSGFSSEQDQHAQQAQG